MVSPNNFWLLTPLIFVLSGTVVNKASIAGDFASVIVNDINVRSGPAATFPTVDQLALNDVVEVLDRRGNWTNAKLENGARGWIFSGVLRQHVQDPSQSEVVSSLRQGQQWALLVGINNYQFWPKLENAVSDVVAVEKLLTEKYGFDSDRIFTLVDGQATEQSIFDTFVKLKILTNVNDSLLIYYAGHGILDEFDVGSWIPVDARPRFTTDYITTHRINTIISKLPAKHVFLVADACYSGSLFENQFRESLDALRYRSALRLLNRSSRQGLSSGGIEQVLDGGSKDHSIFAFHFLETLKNNSEPFLSASEVSYRVSQEVTKRATQTPRWNHLRDTGDEGGEFFFLSRSPNDKPERRPRIPTNQSLLTVTTNPPSSVIYVEGEYVGRSPVRLHNVSGTVSVQSRRDGYHIEKADVHVAKEERSSVELEMRVIEGNGLLSVETIPDNAKLYIDDVHVGVTPLSYAVIPGGKHDIRLEKTAYESIRQSIEIQNNETTSLRFNLINVAGEDTSSDLRTPHQAVTNSFLIRDAQAKIHLFLDAYTKRDLITLEQLAQLSPERRKFLMRIFNNYKSLDVRLDNLAFTPTFATAVISIRSLINHNDNLIQPAESWRHSHVVLTRTETGWGRFQW